MRFWSASRGTDWRQMTFPAMNFKQLYSGYCSNKLQKVEIKSVERLYTGKFAIFYNCRPCSLVIYIWVLNARRKWSVPFQLVGDFQWQLLQTDYCFSCYVCSSSRTVVAVVVMSSAASACCFVSPWLASFLPITQCLFFRELYSASDTIRSSYGYMHMWTYTVSKKKPDPWDIFKYFQQIWTNINNIWYR